MTILSSFTVQVNIPDSWTFMEMILTSTFFSLTCVFVCPCVCAFVCAFLCVCLCATLRAVCTTVNIWVLTYMCFETVSFVAWSWQLYVAGWSALLGRSSWLCTLSLSKRPVVQLCTVAFSFYMRSEDPNSDIHVAETAPSLLHFVCIGLIARWQFNPLHQHAGDSFPS